MSHKLVPYDQTPCSCRHPLCMRPHWVIFVEENESLEHTLESDHDNDWFDSVQQDHPYGVVLWNFVVVNSGVEGLKLRKCCSP